MSRERVAFFFFVVLCVTMVSAATTIQVIEAARMVEGQSKKMTNSITGLLQGLATLLSMRPASAVSPDRPTRGDTIKRRP